MGIYKLPENFFASSWRFFASSSPSERHVKTACHSEGGYACPDDRKRPKNL
jgi:hypothetical protein